MDNEAQGNGATKITVKSDPKGADVHHMPILHRSFVGNGSGSTTSNSGEHSESEEHPENTNDGPETRSSILPRAKHNVIKPPDDFKPEVPAPTEEKPKPAATPKFMDTKPPIKKTASIPQAPTNSDSTEAEALVPAIAGTAAITDQAKVDASSADQAKRQQEIDDIIESRRYFVPVDAIVRKRTMKINVGLTVVILVLAVVLIDLMLDSGMILIVQKIPHTHFFSLNNGK